MKLNIDGVKPLYLPRDPLTPMEAATKQYVDNTVDGHAGNAGLHLTPAQNSWMDAILASTTEVNYLVGVTSGVQSQIDGKVAKTGDTMTGALVLHADPLNALEAATKNYVDVEDAKKVSKVGDTMTGFLTLHADPTSALHASTKGYVDTELTTHVNNVDLHLTSAQNTWLDAIVVSSAEVNYLEGVISSVQAQLNSKLNLAGGTMTGFVTLHAAPTDNLHAATKKYVDDGLALKLSLTGGTLTGSLILSGDPTTSNEAANKGYVDSTVSGHASDQSLHLTASQNTWIDAITATSTEVNYLAGLSSGVQGQIDTKFDKAGGLITGDVTLDTGKTVFVSKVPAADNELVNKAYVDALINGKEWEDPVTAVNLISTTLSTPPATPAEKDAYIVGATATGAWTGKEGYVTVFNGTSWVFLQGRAVAAGDRFGVGLTTATSVGADLTANAKNLVTLVSGTPGNYVWAADTVSAGSTTLVFDPQAPDFGFTYSLNNAGNWVTTNTSVNIAAGDALVFNGNMLNVQVGDGMQIVDDKVVAKLDTATGLAISGTGAIALRYKTSDFQISGDGLTFSAAARSLLDDAVTKSGTSTVTGTVTFSAGAKLVVTDAPIASTDATNKTYVDTADLALQTSINTINTTLNNLTVDPVSKQYVDDGLALKVDKGGDTMTGFLTLHADPTSNLHAATKKYVDDGLSGHATDASLHMSAAQNTWIDSINASSTEINYLVGVTSGVQSQIDGKVAKAGDTMTGELTLFGSPTGVLGAVPKQDLDAGLDLKVAKNGDTMTGALVLHADPTLDLHASTKKYVDDTVLTHSSNAALHLTADQNSWMDAITATSTEINYLVGVTSGVQTQIDGKVAKSGDSMSGFLTLNADPTANLHAATKKYVDDGLALKLSLTGGTLTGALKLASDPVTPEEAATKNYVDTGLTAANTYTDTEAAKKVSKVGDTMTGFLTLHADPTADLHAATKKFVDNSVSNLNTTIGNQLTTINTNVSNLRGDVDGLLVDPVTKNYVDVQDATKLAIAGGTMTGYITLHADPLLPMQPATKQYTDNIAAGILTRPGVRFATTTNLTATYANGSFGVNATLTGSVNGALSVDGNTPLVGDRILVRVQTSSLENGDYVVQQVGDANTPYILKRVNTVDESSEVPGSYFFVYDGATLKGSSWVMTVDNPVTFAIGTDSIAVNQFSGKGTMIGGDGIVIDGNTINVQTADPSRIVVNADNIDLATTGVTPGSYTKLTVDGYGRATAGTNPNTLAGYGIADGQPLNSNLTSLSTVSTGGLLARSDAGVVAARKLTTSGVGISVNNDGAGTANVDLIITSNATPNGTADTIVSRDASGNFTANQITANLTGNASSATQLQNARTFSVSGDVTATGVNFNGTDNVELVATLGDTGITPGYYGLVAVNSQGRVIDGINPTTLADAGITDAYTKTEVDAKIATLMETIAELQAYVMSRI